MLESVSGKVHAREYQGNLCRYQEMFAARKKKCLLCAGSLWIEYQHMVVPVGPVCVDYAPALAMSRARLLRCFPNALFIRGSGGFIPAPADWFALICEQYTPLSDMSAHLRGKIRRGLKHCTVRRVDADTIAAHGWPVYAAAARRYNTRLPKSAEAAFKQSILATRDFEDIVHYWGVFERQHDELIGFAENFIHGTQEVYYWRVDFNPAFFKLYASYALFHEMNRCYLAEQAVGYCNAGFRNLLHKTEIQKYLTMNFNFRQQPVRLLMCHRPFVRRCMDLLCPFQSVVTGMHPHIDALCKLEKIWQDVSAAAGRFGRGAIASGSGERGG